MTQLLRPGLESGVQGMRAPAHANHYATAPPMKYLVKVLILFFFYTSCISNVILNLGKQSFSPDKR